MYKTANLAPTSIVLLSYYCAYIFRCESGLTNISSAPIIKNLDNIIIDNCDVPQVMGGDHSYVFAPELIHQFIKGEMQPSINLNEYESYTLSYVDHIDDVSCLSYPPDLNYLHADVPLEIISPHIPIVANHKIAKLHNIMLSCHN